MFKKAITLFLITAFFTFNLNNKIQASEFPMESFQVDFEAILSPFQTTYYHFLSECIEIPDNQNVVSIQSLTNPNNLLRTMYQHPNLQQTSRLEMFSDDSCTPATSNNNSHKTSDRFFELNDNTGLLGDKPYVFNIGDIANHFGFVGFTPLRSKSFRIIFASNLTLDDLIYFAAFDPFEDQVAVATFITFTTPTILRLNNGFQITERYFINRLPILFPASRAGYEFQYWADITGERQFGQSAINDPSLITENNVYNLYAQYNRIVPSENPILPGDLGGVYDPLDTILFNTGFLNNGGVLLLYFILAISIAVMAFKFKLNSLIAIVLNILLTSFFLILGYLPLYTSVLLIAFYITAIISINKGGFLNE
jgi:hypothetical protein